MQAVNHSFATKMLHMMKTGAWGCGAVAAASPLLATVPQMLMGCCETARTVYNKGETDNFFIREYVRRIQKQLPESSKGPDLAPFSSPILARGSC